MANATVQARYYPTEGTTGESAEVLLKFNREAGRADTNVPVPIPATANTTKFSWRKPLGIHVTGASSPALNITNRTIALSGSLVTGLKFWCDPEASHTAPATGNMPADGVTSDANPNSGAYTEITTTPFQYDNGSVSSGSTGRNGGFATVVMGVSDTYTGSSGGAIEVGAAAAARSLIMGYDEA